VTTATPNAQTRLKNPAMSPIDPANCAAMARKANSAGILLWQCQFCSPGFFWFKPGHMSILG
jgi:hypothetical protein